jgi:hypothetical protein
MGANSVYRLEVIVPAMFPVQFDVELRVYVAFRFMNRPEAAGMNEGV